MSRKNNEFPAEKIGCSPQTHLYGIAQKKKVPQWETTAELMYEK